MLVQTYVCNEEKYVMKNKCFRINSACIDRSICIHYYKWCNKEITFVSSVVPINSCIRKIDYLNSLLYRIQNLFCNKFLCCWIVHKEKLITFKFRPSKNIRLIQINVLWSSLCSIYSFLSIRNTLTRLCRILCLMKFRFIIATNIFAW